MKYLFHKSFAIVPTGVVTQMNWDYAFLSKDDFCTKYNMTEAEYRAFGASLD